MTIGLTVDEVLSTTRSVRKRLDFDRPVPRDILLECLDLAVQAPTAGGSQNWHWLFIEETATKRALADIYRNNLGHHDIATAGPTDVDPDRARRLASSGMRLIDHLQDAPVLLIPCLRGRVDNTPSATSATFWASLMPAVWNLCLALRSRGLGTCWTTLHLFGDGERRAADVVGIPYGQYSQAGLLPIAYTTGTQFRPARRLAAEQISHFDRW